MSEPAASDPYETAALALRAVASAPRLRILSLIAGGCRTTGQLSRHLDLATSTTATHLGTLRRAELVRTERKGERVEHFCTEHPLYEALEGLFDFSGPPDAEAELRKRG